MTRKMKDILEDAGDDLKRRKVCPRCFGTGRRYDPRTGRLKNCSCPLGRARQHGSEVHQ